jgi:hypothetical protein
MQKVETLLSLEYVVAMQNGESLRLNLLVCDDSTYETTYIYMLRPTYEYVHIHVYVYVPSYPSIHGLCY